MKRVRSIIRYVLTWPMFIGYLFPLAFGKDLHFIEDAVLVGTWRDWVVEPRRFLAIIRWPFGLATWKDDKEYRSWWRYNNALSRGMLFQPDSLEDKSVERHERTHTRQAEDLVLLGLILSIAWAVNDSHGVESWLEHLVMWISSIAWQLPNFVMATLRHGIRKIYRRSEHEDHAYALTNVIDVKHVGKSWQEIFEAENRGF